MSKALKTKILCWKPWLTSKIVSCAHVEHVKEYFTFVKSEIKKTQSAPLLDDLYRQIINI